MKTCAFTSIDNYILLYHSNKPPTVEEWNEYMDFALSVLSKHDKVTSFILTEGSGPNARQRKELAERISDYDDIRIQTCIFTDSKIGRGIATAFSWIKKDSSIKAYSIDAMYMGFEWAGVDPSLYHTIKNTFEELRTKIN